MKHICEWCKKEHDVKAYDLKRGHGKTCSKSCSAKLRESLKPKKISQKRYFSEETLIYWG